MARYRVGIIACGSIARSHARGWKANEAQAELVAIADNEEGALGDAGVAWNVSTDHRYLDYREMLDREHLDIVSVCSWHGQHAPMTIAAAARKPKAILCEKPMATCLGEADEMITAARRNNVKLAIGHMRRFYGGWEAARRLIAEGAIGRPQHARSVVAQGLLNWGTHTIDGMRWVLGDPEAEWVVGSVQRDSDRYERSTRVEDSCTGLIQFAVNGEQPGPQVFVQSDLGAGASINWQVIGTEGIISAEENNVRLLNATTGGWKEVVASGPDRGEAFAAQAAEVIAWVDGHIEEYRGEARQARATLEVMMAIYESARLNEVTRLPLQTRLYPLDLMVESGQLPVRRPGEYDIRSFLVRGERMRWEA